jgi:hypothetical protein
MSTFFRRHSVIAAFVGGALVFGGAAFAASFTPFAAGETLSAAKLNANLTALQDRISALEADAAPVVISYNKLIPGWSNNAVLRFSEQRVDTTGGAYSPATGVFTVPAGKGGTYVVAAAALLGRSGNGETSDITAIQINVNDVVVAATFVQFKLTIPADGSNSVSAVLRLVPGDRLSVGGYVNVASGRVVNPDNSDLNFLTIARIGN